VKLNLAQFPAFAPAIGFYNTQAELALRRRDAQVTEASIRSAIFLAEWALRSFPAERFRREWAKQTEPAYRNLVAWKISQGDAQGALELWEWYGGAEFRGETTNPDTMPFDLANAVPPNAANAGPIEIPSVVSERISLEHEKTFITYAAFRDGLAIWVYDDRGIHLQWVDETRADLEERVQRFQRLCSTPESDLTAVRSAGRALYDLLIAPVRQHLSGERILVFEPDDILSAVPIEALVDDTGRYLIERTDIVISPGFYRTQRLRVAAPLNRGTRVLVVSVPVVSEQSLPVLTDADAEAEIVARRFDGARLLRGTAANLPQIRAELAHAEIFHFAGHALALPERNGLMLAQRDQATRRPVLVNSENIGSRDLEHLRLAVLSACDTNLTPETGNSGTESLSQAMLSDGVSDVIASRWQVDSAATSTLMQTFYAHLLDGYLTSSSLRYAEMQLLSSVEFAHPYFWAAFAVHGV
jgi:CHAT domain-containing protein